MSGLYSAERGGANTVCGCVWAAMRLLELPGHTEPGYDQARDRMEAIYRDLKTADRQALADAYVVMHG